MRPPILSRDDVMRELQLSLSRRREWRSRNSEEADSNVVKTYLVEAHLAESAPRDVSRTTVKRLFSSVAQVYDLKDDPEFLRIVAGNEQLEYFLDISNSRYWVAHTTAKSDMADRFIAKTVNSTPELDRAWMPTNLLDDVSTFGKFRGWAARYGSERFGRTEPFTMTVGNSVKADVLLDMVRKNHEFEDSIALAKVRVKYGQTKADATTTDVNYDGRVSSRGGDISHHLETLNKTFFNLYVPIIRKIEERFSLLIDADREDGIHLRGEPIYFRLKNNIDDLEQFCKRVFSSKEPFKLWGVPQMKGKNSYFVDSVDLHVGNRLRFEIYPSVIRVFLPKDSCGNTILRFYTNLQHNEDPRVQMVDANMGSLL